MPASKKIDSVGSSMLQELSYADHFSHIKGAPVG
jgi:hypothetical protein